MVTIEQRRLEPTGPDGVPDLNSLVAEHRPVWRLNPELL